ncbi:uncharacterized protein FFB14_11027 [Fusarium fujikuroi]|nr:uncharacterized protein FFB14_11027 [Fusarium fujikuroi]
MGQSMSSDFESFDNLPPELRLMIWEEALPKKKDTHVAYKIFHDAFLRGLRLEKPEGADGPRPLLEACYDSRAVAMKRIFEKRYHSVWVDNSITTLHVPIAALTCGRITDLPTNIKAVACMVPTPQALRALQKCLTHDLEYKGIKTVYLGIAGIPIQYSKGDDPDSYPCTELESAVVPLDGKKLITYLESAYKTHVLEADLRSKWDPKNGIELLPAVIFGQKTGKVMPWSKGRLRGAVFKLQIGRREAQADLKWMHGFAFDNRADHEDDLDELPCHQWLRRMARREKDRLRNFYWSPHNAEGEKRWNAAT